MPWEKARIRLLARSVAALSAVASIATRIRIRSGALDPSLFAYAAKMLGSAGSPLVGLAERGSRGFRMAFPVIRWAPWPAGGSPLVSRLHPQRDDAAPGIRACVRARLAPQRSRRIWHAGSCGGAGTAVLRRKACRRLAVLCPPRPPHRHCPRGKHLTWPEIECRRFGARAAEVPGRARLFSPIAHSGPACPPTMLIHGAHDGWCPLPTPGRCRRRCAVTVFHRSSLSCR